MGQRKRTDVLGGIAGIDLVVVIVPDCFFAKSGILRFVRRQLFRHTEGLCPSVGGA